jgi:hypothetical protein
VLDKISKEILSENENNTMSNPDSTREINIDLKQT